MGYPDYQRDLLVGTDDEYILHRYFHSGQSACFFGAPPDAEPILKNQITNQVRSALGVQLHPLQLILCGSAHLGFSPVPEKLGIPFNSVTSDIDVAVVSPELFDLWWAELQSAELVAAVRSRVAEDLFWGFINPANVYKYTKIGKTWWDAFGSITTERAKCVRGRLYRNYWSMQSYHRLAIIQGRNKLQDKRTE